MLLTKGEFKAGKESKKGYEKELEYVLKNEPWREERIGFLRGKIESLTQILNWCDVRGVKI